MKKTSHLRWILPTFLVLFIGLVLHFRGRQTSSRSFDFSAFHTGCSVTYWGGSPSQGEAMTRELLVAMQDLHDRFNIYDEHSELARLNATAARTPFPCSDTLWDALQEARRGVLLTEGAFDPTVGPLMRLWGYHNKRDSLPTQQEIEDARALVGFANVQLDDVRHSVLFRKAGMSLDFGGLAKGYACKVASRILEKHGISIYLLNFGGNVCLSSLPPPDRKDFLVGIQHPRHPQEMATTIHALGTTIATSGNYERSRIIEGRKVGHIMDPRTGIPCDFLPSATAICTAPTLADILSTAIFVGGEPLARKLAVQEIRFLLIQEDGILRIPEDD